MEIKFHGHSCFELIEGEARVLVDPFLKPNNPKAIATAEDVEPTHIALSHGHADHLADAIPVAKRTGAHCIAIVELAKWLEVTRCRGGQRPEPRRHGRVRLGLDQAGPRLAHEHDSGLRRGAVQRRARDLDRHRRRAADQHRRRHRLSRG